MAERFETTSSPNVVNSNNDSSPSNKSHVDTPNSTGPILTSSSQISEYSIFFGVLGLIPILVVILIIASVVIVLLRKSKMRADQSSAENGLQQLTTATDDLEGEVQTPWTASAADGAGTRVRPHDLPLPPLQTITPTKHLPERREVVGDYDTPRRHYNRHSSNYTPMELNSPISSSSNSSSNSSSSRVNKTSFSANIYADLSQIASQRGTDNRRISIDPVVEVTDVDCVYYNSVVLAAAAANRAPRHGHASYETCYSPDGGGGARLEFQNSNANGCEFYAAIRDCGGGGATVDLSNTESLYSNEQLYCNIGQERADNNVSQINETILIENPSYAGKKAST